MRSPASSTWYAASLVWNHGEVPSRRPTCSSVAGTSSAATTPTVAMISSTRRSGSRVGSTIASTATSTPASSAGARMTPSSQCPPAARTSGPSRPLVTALGAANAQASTPSHGTLISTRPINTPSNARPRRSRDTLIGHASQSSRPARARDQAGTYPRQLRGARRSPTSLDRQRSCRRTARGRRSSRTAQPE